MHSVYSSSSAIVSLKGTGISDYSNPVSGSRAWLKSSSGSGQKVGCFSRSQMENMGNKVVVGAGGYVLEDVPHFSDYIPHLPVRRRFYPSFLIVNL